MPSRPVLISDMPGVVFLSLKSKNGHARYRACGECDVSKFISSYWLEAPVDRITELLACSQGFSPGIGIRWSI